MASKIVTEAGCIFCKIIKGEIPSFKILETEKTFAFLDIGPVSKGHALVIPKYHSEFLHQQPDEFLADALPVAKQVAKALGAENYNLLQNNGALAHQQVPHVHFHVIPKPNTEEGLGIKWPASQPSKEDFQKELERIKNNL